MILNSYAVLSGFVILIRIACSLGIVAAGISLYCDRRPASSIRLGQLENRYHLLSQLAATLLVFNLVSWPLLYLLLDSYVPVWPGVMCIYGVTQIGAGSDGPSRFLPSVLQALQLLKPLMIFGGGAWLMLFLANRWTAKGALLGRVVFVLFVLSLLALLDAILEVAYLVIPKQEEYLAAGCCVGLFGDNETRFLPTGWIGDDFRTWLLAAYFGGNLAMVLALRLCVSWLPSLRLSLGFGVLLALAVVVMAVNVVFLCDILAPALLRLPHHHCPYDLVARAPEALLGVASFMLGAFAIGWACVAAWFGAHPQNHAQLGDLVRKLLVVSWFAYLGSLAMTAIELLLA